MPELTKPPGAGAEVRIVNPEPLPGFDGILAPRGDQRAWLAPEDLISKIVRDRTKTTIVMMVPSIRRNMEYDLCTYPIEWVTEID